MASDKTGQILTDKEDEEDTREGGGATQGEGEEDREKGGGEETEGEEGGGEDTGGGGDDDEIDLSDEEFNPWTPLAKKLDEFEHQRKETLERDDVTRKKVEIMREKIRWEEIRWEEIRWEKLQQEEEDTAGTDGDDESEDNVPETEKANNIEIPAQDDDPENETDAPIEIPAEDDAPENEKLHLLKFQTRMIHFKAFSPTRNTTQIKYGGNLTANFLKSNTSTKITK